VIYTTLWAPRAGAAYNLCFPIIKGGPHAYKKKNNRRCIGGSARRVFGFNAKVRNQSERSHAEGNVRSDLRRFKAICTAMLIENSLTSWGQPMKKQILTVTAVAVTGAVVILNGTSAAIAQQTPQYQVGGFPITPHQMLVLQPSAKISEQQRFSRQPTMDASRRAGARDFGIGGNTGY
jgi:hypothetical protein